MRIDLSQGGSGSRVALRVVVRVIAAAAAISAARTVTAQTWDGGGIDANWTTPNNWNPNAVPQNNGTANIVFGGNVQLAPVVNSNQDILGLTFNNTAGIFTIGGPGTLTIRGNGITNNDLDTQTISAPLALLAAQTWASTSGPLAFNGASVTTGAFLLTLNTTQNMTISNAISGAGGLTKSGAGVLTLSGANMLGGVTTISAGTLRIGADFSLTGLVSVASGATLDVNGKSDVVTRIFGAGTVSLPGVSALSVDEILVAAIPFDGVLAGDATATFSNYNGHTVLLNGNNTFVGTYRLNGGGLRTGASERIADAADIYVSGATPNGLAIGAGFTETVDQITLVSGQIGGLSATSKLQFNTLELQAGKIDSIQLIGTGAVTKTTAGTVLLYGAHSYSGTTSINAGTLQVMASAVLSPASAMTIANGATLQFSTSGQSGYSGNVASFSGTGSVIFASTLSPSILNVGDGNVDSTFGGAISGNGKLTKVGNGVLTLDGASSYSAETTIFTGTIRLGTGNDRLPTSTALRFSTSSATLDLQTFNQTVASLDMTGGAIIGSGILTCGDIQVQAGTISARLAGAGALVKSGFGTLILSGSNSYSGGTELLAGVLAVSASANLGSTSPGLTFDGGTLRFDNSFSTSRAIAINAGGGTIDTRAATTLSGVITANGPLTKIGPGTLALTSTAPQLAALTINAGEFILPAGGSLLCSGALTLGAAGRFSPDGGVVSAATISNAGDLEPINDALLLSAITNTGTLRGAAHITGAVTNAAAGNIRVEDGQRLDIAGAASYANAGLVEVVGGDIEYGAALTNNASTGLIYARNAGLWFSGGLTNNGSVSCSFGTTDIFGDVVNSASGVILISGGSDATFVDDVVNSGSIRTSAGGAVVFLGAVSGAGSFPGTGTVYLEGDMRPGASPANVNFGGDLVFGGAANTEIELGGLTSGSQHDKLTIAGDAILDGTLTVRPINGFAPSPGNQFTILTAAQVVGTFASVVPIGFPPGAQPQVRYSPTQVTLRIPGGVRGDMNCDGVITNFDIDPWVLALVDEAAYAAAFPNCSRMNGDINQDGAFNNFDIDPFVVCIVNLGCP